MHLPVTAAGGEWAPLRRRQVGHQERARGQVSTAHALHRTSPLLASCRASPAMKFSSATGWMSAEEAAVVLITGCSEGGIGYSLARKFADEGCLVVATARSAAAMSGLADDPRFFLQQLDVLSETSVREAVDAVLGKFGRIDILVNNAGVHLVAPLAEVPMPELDNVFNTNVFGPMRLIQAVVPHMIARRKGKIVNVGSISALACGPWAGAYSASKAALHALNDAMRFELRGFGIQVIIVVPGAILSNIGNTSLAKYNDMPEWKFYGHLKDAIKERATLLQSPKSTPTQEFTRKMVAEVLKPYAPYWFSYGRFSTNFAILYHLPLFLRDLVYSRILKS